MIGVGMREGDVVSVTVEKLGSGGDGLAVVEGKMLYLPRALPGEEVRVTLGKPLGQGFQIAGLQVVSASPDRQAASCPHFSQCGGCSMQHLDEKAYLNWKQEIVKTALRQQHLGEVRVLPVLPVGPGTRRRLTMAALFTQKGSASGQVVLGYNARASHQIIDAGACPVARPELVAILPVLRRALLPWLRQAKTLDVSLTLVDNGIDLLLTGAEPTLEAREAIAALSAEPSLARIGWRKTERSTPEPMLMMREPVLTLGGQRVMLPIGVFLQPSVEGEKILLSTILSALPPGQTRIADLFSGCGTFSLPLTSLAPVWAVDGFAPGLQAMPRVRNLTTQQQDLFRDPVMAVELKDYSAVVFDPPRAGAAAQVEELAKSDVPTIIAVSCNPGTFARDAAVLVGGGYELEWVQPVDQFLWSEHVELVAKFARF